MNKITAEHLQRSACVYIRQSTPDQLVHNLEASAGSMGLPIAPASLAGPTVEIIDDDLGHRRRHSSPGLRASAGRNL